MRTGLSRSCLYAYAWQQLAFNYRTANPLLVFWDLRIGRNYFAWAEMLIKQPILLVPGNRVLKAGRTTEVTFGAVSGAVVLSWEDGRLSSEIAVVGSGMAFADNGDSGALCVVEIPDEELHGDWLLYTH